MDCKYRLFSRKTAFGDKINPKLTFILESAEIEQVISLTLFWLIIYFQVINQTLKLILRK